MTKAVNLVLIMLVFGLFCAAQTYAQTTEISYQGNLKESGQPANANYDIEFRLFNAAIGGTMIGSEIYLSPVTVTEGVFSVKLDFGANGFPGADRYLEIAVRRSGVGSLVTLGPRQKIGSAPYAVQSLQAATATTAMVAANATALGGVNASQYIMNGDARLTDARNPLPGSANYIQNTNAQQAASNFNITGNGSAATFNATSRYNFAGNHLISAHGAANTFAGASSGLLTTGNSNAFFGATAGQENKQGSFNAFFGTGAGQLNVTGNNNSFFGYFAGNGTTSGNDNSFFGNRAGQVNTSGAFNSFFGTFSGFFNTTGTDNSFFGNETGYNNNNGNRNSFLGSKAGRENSTGSDNAFVGSFAGRANTTGSKNSFVGSRAGESNATGQNNSFFGTESGSLNTASNNSFFGTNSGKFNSTGAHNTFLGHNAGVGNTVGELNVFVGVNAGLGNILGRLNTIVGAEANVLGSNLSYATAIGAEAVVNSSNTVVLGRPADDVRVPGNFIVAKNLSVAGTLTAQNLNFLASNIQGVIGTANGGTGLSSPGLPGRFLRSNGTGWISSPFTVEDIPGGSGLYVQNSTTQQGSTNFNISGNGNAGGTLSGNAINSSTQYNINGSRVLIASTNNLFAGLTAGNANTTGSSNSFVGASAGSLNTSGSSNSFFGSNAGLNSISGANNSFVGASAGTGNTIGSNNAFFGTNAGQTNTLGSNNTVLGSNANVGGSNLTYATAVGSDAVVTTSNTVVLGRNVDLVRIPGNLDVIGTLNATTFNVPTSSLQGQVGVANGGTGMNTSGPAGSFLRSNGSIWVASSIAASDIPSGSVNYIQNGLAQQASSNFNVSGNGTVGGAFSGNSVNSQTQYNISGTRVLSNTGASNIFVGAGTGTTGSDNSFFGVGAGTSNMTGFSNTLIGSGANVGVGNLTFATAVGAGAVVSNNNSVVLGRSSDTVRIPGGLAVAGSITGTFSVSAENLGGIVGIGNGGTGLNTVGASGHFLRSNGAAWTTGALTAGDIPNLAASYVQNGSAVQPGANFNIGGNGSIVGNLTVGGSINGSLSASNISGVLAADKGGTGIVGAGSSGHFLKSNGSGWTTALLAAGDIPAGSTSYIQNGTTPQAATNFAIAGSGTIGTNLSVGGNLTVNGTLNGSFTVPAANIQGPIPVGSGGTGLTASTGTNFLRGNGAGGWTTGALQPGDLPSLGGTYIQNGTTPQSSSNFNISGDGTVGGTVNANVVNAVQQFNINGQRVFATTGTSNIFAGAGTGITGSSNAFFGAGAGSTNSSGSGNTLIGANANVTTGTLTNATAIGANAAVSQSNSVVIGGINGVNGGSDTNVGIGTAAPKAKLEVAGGNILIGGPGQGIILKSPDGSKCKLFSIDNAGATLLTDITCP